MKIIVKADGHNIRLWFPLSIVKSRIGYKAVNDVMVGKSDKESDNSLSREQVAEVYNILKRCVNNNGHFNLIEVESADGEKVLIRV